MNEIRVVDYRDEKVKCEDTHFRLVDANTPIYTRQFDEDNEIECLDASLYMWKQAQYMNEQEGVSCYAVGKAEYDKIIKVTVVKLEGDNGEDTTNKKIS